MWVIYWQYYVIIYIELDIAPAGDLEASMGPQPTYFDETGWRVTKRGRYSPRHKVGELRI